MVLSKASVWYESLVRPLRRLTSATSNALFVSLKQPARAQSPVKSRASERLKSNDPPITELAFGEHPELLSTQKQQQQQQTWEDFLQNPLDVILKDSLEPGHPINLTSQSINQPFSTSVVVEARRQPPEKGTSRPIAERPNSRNPRVTTHVPRPTSARSKEVGSKKYRKYFKDKIIRKGPHFNIRRQNRLCMRPCLGDSTVSSPVSFKDGLKDEPFDFRLLNGCYNLPEGSTSNQLVEAFNNISLGEQARELNAQILKPAQGMSVGTVEDEKTTIKPACSESPDKVVGEEASVEYAQTSNEPRKQNNNVSTFNNRHDKSDVASTKTVSKRCVNPLRENTPKTVLDKSPCFEDTHQISRNGSNKRASLLSIRDNLQEAAQGFKCNLWKRAVTGDPPLQNSFAPCNVAAKSR